MVRSVVVVVVVVRRNARCRGGVARMAWHGLIARGSKHYTALRGTTRHDAALRGTVGGTARHYAALTFALGVPERDPCPSIVFIISRPSNTSPNTTCLPSSHGVFTVQMKKLRAVRVLGRP